MGGVNPLETLSTKDIAVVPYLQMKRRNYALLVKVEVTNKHATAGKI